MKRKSLIKLGVIVMSSCIPLSMQSMLRVDASNQVARADTDLRVDGPTFYQLDDKGEVKVDYKQTSDNALLRYEKELQDLQAGNVRTIVNVSNRSPQGKPVRLISVLEDKDKHTEDVLEVSELDYIEGNAQVTLTTDVQIPSEGNFEFKTYLWDEVNGMRPLKDTTVLSTGATNLQYTHNGVYNKDKPSIVLTWTGAQDVVSYDIYVEGEKVGSTQDVTYTMDLEPYTAYKISVQAIRSDGKNAAMSNSLYFMSEDTQASQDARMSEWNANRFGMFIHWGGYASFAGVFNGLDTNGNEINYDSAGGGNGAYSEWIKFGAGIPDDTYKNTVDQNFTAENYDPAQWVQVAKDAGMKYIILTSKHHEGLALFNTAVNNGWSVKDTAAAAKENAIAEKDFIRQLILEGAKEGIDVGVYYSQSIDWAQKGSIGWTPQRQSKWSSEQIAALKQEVIASGIDASTVDTKIYDLLGGANYEDMVKMNNEVIVPQVEELLTMKVDYNGKEYGIDTLWWDMGQHDYPEMNYEIVKKVTTIDTEKKIKMNNRMHHKETYTTMPFDFITPEQSIPSAPNAKYWETCMTMNDNWGYAKNDDNWKQSPELIEKLTRIASMGGNFLMNVGPKPDGSFPDEAVTLLGEVGDYMDVNGEGIYGTSKSPFLNDLPWGYATQKKDKIYLHVLEQENLDSLIIPGLKTAPRSARVITGANQYSEPLQIARSETYKGFELTGTALTSTHAVGTLIVLQFDNELIAFEESSEKFPVIQNAETGKVTFKPSDAAITSNPNDGLIYESGGNFGRWNHESDFATWKLKATKPGTYSVDVDFATPMKGSLYVQIKDKEGVIIAEAKSQFEPSASSDQWVTYKNQLLGTVDIDEVGDYTVEIHRQNSGPDSSSASNGAVNIKTVHMNPIQEYSLETIGQDAQSKQLNLTSSKGIRSGGLGYVGANITYGMKNPASTFWKVKVEEAKEYTVHVHGATDGNDANIQLALKDDQLKPVMKNNQPVQVTEKVKTAQWTMSDTVLSATFSIDPGTYYIDLSLLKGEMNFEGITLVDASQLDVSNDSFLFDKDTTTQTLTSNKAITVESANSSVVSVSKVNDKEWTITKVATSDAQTTLKVQSISDATQEKEINVQVMNGKLNEVSSVESTAPDTFVSIYNAGSPTFEQDITSALQGKGIYKLTMKYRSAKELTYALGIGNDWKTGKFPATSTWKEATLYLSNSYDGDTQPPTIIKPIDNFGSIGIENAIDISSVSFKKLNSTEEVIENPTLSNGLDKWNRSNVHHINQDKTSFYLRAYDAVLENVVTVGKTNDLMKEVSDSKALYGKLGNWWDHNDSAYWTIQVKETGYYRANAFYERLWNDTYMKAEVIDKNNQVIETLRSTIVENDAKSRDMGLVYLQKDETYKIKVSRTIGDEGLYMPVGIDLKLANEAVMNACVQNSDKKFDCSVGKAVSNGESVRMSTDEASYWNKKEESLTWKLDLKTPDVLKTVLHYANVEAGAVSVSLYDDKGQEVISQTKMIVNRMDGWGNYGYGQIGTLDLTSYHPGTYYLKIHNTGEKGINLKTLILEK